MLVDDIEFAITRYTVVPLICNQDQVRIALFEGIVKERIPFLIRIAAILIADLQVVDLERLGMSCGCAQGAIVGCEWTRGILHEVQSILDKRPHLFQGDILVV